MLIKSFNKFAAKGLRDLEGNFSSNARPVRLAGSEIDHRL
jgi:hypothetical protein